MGFTHIGGGGGGGGGVGSGGTTVGHPVEHKKSKQDDNESYKPLVSCTQLLL
jgi:hypothetical protein